MACAGGVILATLAGLLGWWARFDQSRAFYPVILIVVATYYDLFAVLAEGDFQLLGVELGVTTVFVALAVLGFRTNLWWVVGGLAVHGVFDLFHSVLVVNPGVPVWWPPFCLSFDVAAAVFLAFRIERHRNSDPWLDSRPRSLRSDAKHRL